MSRVILLSMVIGVSASAATARAHHSFAAEFDANKPVTVRGVITEIKWENPHSWVFLDAKDQNGRVTRWGFEGCGPACLVRNGVKASVFKPGITVTIMGFRARDLSRNYGSAREAVLDDGQRLLLGPKGN
jgi:hypothetical protein